MWHTSTMVERSVASKQRFYFRRRSLPRGWRHLRFVACLEMIVKDVPSVSDYWCAGILATQTQLGSPFGRTMQMLVEVSYWLPKIKHPCLNPQCENFKVDLEETKWKQRGLSQACNSLNNKKINLKNTSRFKAQPCKCNNSWPGSVLRLAPAQALRWI